VFPSQLEDFPRESVPVPVENPDPIGDRLRPGFNENRSLPEKIAEDPEIGRDHGPAQKQRLFTSGLESVVARGQADHAVRPVQEFKIIPLRKESREVNVPGFEGEQIGPGL
jgi:hypothetical protein